MNRLLSVCAVTVLVVGAWWLIRPAPAHLYDADLNRLAESPLEGFCSGVAYWSSRGKGNATVAASCRSTGQQEADIHLDGVIVAFCDGVISQGFIGNRDTECVAVIAGGGMWPTIDGRLTQAFTKHYPYPGDIWKVPVTDDSSRTGDRLEPSRDGTVRGG